MQEIIDTKNNYQKYSIEQVKKMFLEKNLLCLETIYVNMSFRMKYKCLQCSYKGKKSLKSFLISIKNNNSSICGNCCYQSKEFKEKCSKIMIERYKDPKEREKISKRWQDPLFKEKMLKIMNSSNYKKKISKKTKERYKDPEYKKKWKEANEKRLQDPEYIKKWKKRMNEIDNKPRREEKLENIREIFYEQGLLLLDNEYVSSTYSYHYGCIKCHHEGRKSKYVALRMKGCFKCFRETEEYKKSI